MSVNMVRILRARRFVLDQNNKNENCVYIDAVELDGPDGEPEVWARALRQEGHEERGELIVWRRHRFVTYESHVEGRREFEGRAGRILNEVEIVKEGCPTMEPGPSDEDRRR